MEPIRVMVTGVGGGGLGEQILKALCIAETPYEIFGGDMSRYSAGLASVDHPYILPPADDREYVDTILRVCEQNQVRALFNGSEPELKVISRERKRFEDAGIFLPINPVEVIDICMDKSKTMAFLKNAGFTVPNFATIKSINDLEQFGTLPAVIKPSQGSGGSSNIFIVQSRDELLTFGRYLLSIYPEFIVQAYVGTPEDEYTVGVLVDMTGVLINSIAVHRNILSRLGNRIKIPNRSGRLDLGPVLAISSGYSHGVVGPFPMVCQTCEKIAEKLGARGVINIQCRFVDGEAYIFEINPRFSGTTSLRAMVGCNEPDVLIRRHLLNENI
ncbi:MAG: ATP-grasp domain-containing protein, partial [Thermodesulfobacteriota bacterium]